jgi:HK97 family phage portal protein
VNLIQLSLSGVPEAPTESTSSLTQLDLGRIAPDRKANPASKVILLGLNVSGPGTVPHKDFAGLAKNSFERNATVYGCVSTIAQACATVPWVVYEFDGTRRKQAKRILSAATYRKAFLRSHDRATYPTLAKTLARTEVSDHPLLRLLERPNPEQAQGDYVEQLLSYWLIAGNTYEHFLSPTTGSNKGKPREMWVHRPDRMTVVRATDPANGVVGSYRYSFNQHSEEFARDAIIHHKFFNPTDDFYGMSPLQAAIRAWQTENLGADWNFALLNNAGRPSGAVVVPTIVGDDTYERLKSELKDSYAGSTNAGTPMFLEGGMKWEPMGLSPMEMDFLAGMRDAAIRICRVYHLAPEIIGVPDAKTYNSLAEARKAMWQEANLPLLDRLRDSYNQRLAPLYGDRIFIDYDRDQIDAIQEDQGKVWDKLNRTTFISTNEKRDAAGYESYDDPLADVPQSILNPTPGATGQPGFPEGTVSSLRALREFMVKALDELPDATPEQKAAALAFFDEHHGIEEKAQRLTGKQRKLEVMLRRALSRHFAEQGADFANFLQNEVRKIA